MSEITQSTITISNVTELQDIDQDPTADYVLGSDIDASETANWTGGFEPISDFSGTFDGNGYEITGLTIDRPDTDNVGLFGTVTGTVTDVGLVDCDITGYDRTGGLTGDNDNGTSERV
jgi:hypothetical protein